MLSKEMQSLLAHVILEKYNLGYTALISCDISILNRGLYRYSIKYTSSSDGIDVDIEGFVDRKTDIRKNLLRKIIDN